MIGDRLRQTRLAAGLTLEELRVLLRAQGCGLTRAALSKYELNKSTPPAGTLMRLARALDVPPSRFLQESQLTVTWLAFRKHPRLPVARQEQIKAYALLVAEQQIWLEGALGVATPATLPPSRPVSTAEDAEQASRDLREVWKLGDAPIESVTQTAETHGAVVIAWSHDEGMLDGLSAWVNGRTPLAVVNDTIATDRRRFTLAHEFGHMVMTVEGDETATTEEQFAHRFAGAFLVPSAVAIQELGKRRRHISLREIALLKQKYGLSMLGWIHRARELEIIDEGLYRSLYRTFTAQGWKKVEPEAYHGDETPTRLEQMTARAVAEGILSEVRARQICPRAVTTPRQAEEETDKAPSSLREVLALSRAERERAMAGAARDAAVLYREGTELTDFDAYRAEDFLGDAGEG